MTDADLSLGLKAKPPKPDVEGKLTYKFEVANAGPADATASS